MKWLDRSLLLGPRVAFVISEREFRAAKKAGRVACSDPWLEPGWHACTHAYHDPNGQLFVIVAVDLAAAATVDPIDVAALLAHEAVHVWQYIEDRLGPADLGKEMPAYAIQNIAAGLMWAYRETLK